MIRRIATSLRNDTRGAVAPMVALASVALIGSAGLALDAGLFYVGNRNLQAATEAAALSAAIDPAHAQSRAIAFLQRNGYPDITPAKVSVEVGGYCADIDRASSARFFVGGAPADCAGHTMSSAVRLHTTDQSRRYLTSIFGGGSLLPELRGTATAARIDEAGLEVTSGVLDVTLVNNLLSALAGLTGASRINLNTSQLQALQANNVDAGLMFAALPRQSNVRTYADLLQQTVSLADLMNACVTALDKGSQPPPANLKSALQLIAGAGGSVQVPLAGLFQLGVWRKMPVRTVDEEAGQKQSLRAGLNAYQLIAYALQTNNRTAALSVLDIGIAGVAQVALDGTVTTNAARPRFGFGPADAAGAETAVYTSAVRIKLAIRLANLGTLLGISGLNGLGADIPLLITIGEGKASLRGISCGQEAASDARVDVAGEAGLLNAYLGTLPADAMTRQGEILPGEVTPAQLASVPLVAKISIRAVAGPVIGGSGTPTFLQVSSGGSGVIGHPPYAGTPVRVGSQTKLGDLLGDLGSGLSAEVCVPILGLLGLPCVTTGSTVSALTTPVANLLHLLAIDPLLSNLLGALGVQAGFADTSVTGVRCGVPVLV